MIMIRMMRRKSGSISLYLKMRLILTSLNNVASAADGIHKEA